MAGDESETVVCSELPGQTTRRKPGCKTAGELKGKTSLKKQKRGKCTPDTQKCNFPIGMNYPNTFKNELTTTEQPRQDIFLGTESDSSFATQSVFFALRFQGRLVFKFRCEHVHGFPEFRRINLVDIFALIFL
jgi:hypothetical protein